MAGIKISALPAVGAAQLTDIFPVVQAGVTSKETVSQLTTLISSTLSGTFVPIAGGTMTGPLILSQDPTLPLMAATKEYVDQFASGITVILSAQCATTANLNATYANGAAGVGATLTNAGAMVALVVDGFSVSVSDRVLVKNQTSTFENGVYTVTTVGSGAVNWVLTRATDYDQAPSEIKPGTLVPVDNGTVNANSSWLETATVTTIGVDPILFSQFTSNPAAFLLKANNLSDVASAPASLVNLGLGVPTGTGNVVLQTAPTLIAPIASSLAFSPTTSGIIGTTAGDNASAGIVGEFISSTGTAVALTAAVISNITTIMLSAGDWDVWGNVGINFSSAGNLVVGWISSTSATLPSLALTSIRQYNTNIMAGDNAMTVPMLRFSLAGATTIYLSIDAVFSGSASAYGMLQARRVR